MIRKEIAAYRQRAKQCRRAAERAADIQTKAYWLEGEKRWLSLADTLEVMAARRTIDPLENVLGAINSIKPEKARLLFDAKEQGS